MSSYNFSGLPTETHRALSKYCAVSDLIALSQTSQRFRNIYKPLSWNQCTIFTAKADFLPFFQQNQQRGTVRIIPVAMLDNPRKYSWFVRQNTVTLILDRFDTIFSLGVGSFEEFLDKVAETFPNLKEIRFDDKQLLSDETIRDQQRFLSRALQAPSCPPNGLMYSFQCLENITVIQRMPEVISHGLAKMEINDYMISDGLMFESLALSSFKNLYSVKLIMTSAETARKAFCSLNLLPKCTEVSVSLFDSGMEVIEAIDDGIKALQPSVHSIDLVFGGMPGRGKLKRPFALSRVRSISKFENRYGAIFDVARLADLDRLYEPFFCDCVDVDYLQNITTVTKVSLPIKDSLVFARALDSFPNLNTFDYHFRHRQASKAEPQKSRSLAQHLLETGFAVFYSFSENLEIPLSSFNEQEMSLFRHIAHMAINDRLNPDEPAGTVEEEWEYYAYDYFLLKLLAKPNLRHVAVKFSNSHPLTVLSNVLKYHRNLYSLLMRIDQSDEEYSKLFLERLGYSNLTLIPHNASYDSIEFFVQM